MNENDVQNSLNLTIDGEVYSKDMRKYYRETIFNEKEVELWEKVPEYG